MTVISAEIAETGCQAPSRTGPWSLKPITSHASCWIGGFYSRLEEEKAISFVSTKLKSLSLWTFCRLLPLVLRDVASCCLWCEALCSWKAVEKQNFQPCPSMPWRTTPTSSAIFLKATWQRHSHYLPTVPTLPDGSDQLCSESFSIAMIAALSARSQLRKIVNYDTCQTQMLKASVSFQRKMFLCLAQSQLIPRKKHSMRCRCIRNDWLNDW